MRLGMVMGTSENRRTVAGRTTRVSEVALPPRLLDIEEVAEHLGVTVRHVRRLVAERRIPLLRWGHLLRFDPEELAAWLEEARVDARPVGSPYFPGRSKTNFSKGRSNE